MTRRLRISISGQVQGVGFRPHVWTCAHLESLTGFVRNDSNGVTIEVEGPQESLERFEETLLSRLPPLAVVDSLTTEHVDPINDIGFTILESTVLESTSTPIAPDVSVCADCLSEMQDPTDRRFRYPFINCTNCGPRYTILEDIPYDRSQTTMRSFPMCQACRAEYEDPSNRRFHAQPNACPKCGPRIWYVNRAEEVSENPTRDAIMADGAIEEFAEAIAKGKIVATKGIGGFHLACDPHNSRAIASLRMRKGRVDKPFAIMVRSSEIAAEIGELNESALSHLTSVQRPIVLLKKKKATRFDGLLNSIAPGNDFVGVMLPYSPLHVLLMERHDALLMTSGNISEEPIVRTNLEAAERLRHLADGFLLHDREIHSVCDDSVVRCVDRQLLPIRRSRGYSPMPIRLASDGPSVLAVGGEIKATFCLTKGEYAYMSPHIGDVGNLETLNALRRGVEHFTRLYRVELDAIAADMHPGYLSHAWSNQLAAELNVPFIPVQHHVAHAMSLIGEQHESNTSKFLACCLDGTGYGEDDAIWGGEFLLMDSNHYRRWAHLEYFPLPGGDISIKRPYRVALACLQHFDVDWNQAIPAVNACPFNERRVLRTQVEKHLNCVWTSSFGRLFDAVASIIGIRHVANYEAQAAMEMEAAAGESREDSSDTRYAFTLTKGDSNLIGFRTLLKQVCDDVEAGFSAGLIALHFHRAVADLIVRLAINAREDHAITRVGITGGVFQNVLLTQLTTKLLKERGFDVITHSQVPPNDGGIALGQAIYARHALLRAQDN